MLAKFKAIIQNKHLNYIQNHISLHKLLVILSGIIPKYGQIDTGEFEKFAFQIDNHEIY